jgi:hypothetical protein
MMHITTALAAEHYSEHKDKPFFGELVDFITSGPVVAMILEGDGVIAMVRSMMGATDPRQAAPGTIRGDYAPASIIMSFTVQIRRKVPGGRSEYFSAAAGNDNRVLITDIKISLLIAAL